MAESDIPDTSFILTKDRIARMTLFDDSLMSTTFENNKEATACILRIILQDPEIEVISVKTQYEIKNLYGRSIRLDINLNP